MSRQGPNFGLRPRVLVADVEPTEVGFAPVDDDELAVIAKVHPESSAPVAVGDEDLEMDAGVGEGEPVGLAELARADLIDEQTHGDAPAPGGEDVTLQPLPEAIVSEDEELDENE